MTQQGLPKDLPTDPWPAPILPLARARARGERGGVRGESSERARERVREKHSPSQLPHSQKLTASETRLSRWLKQKLGTAGADAMIKEYGARAILDALHDGIIVWSDDPTRGRLGRKAWVPNPKLHSPGGFLRRTLQNSRGAP